MERNQSHIFHRRNSSNVKTCFSSLFSFLVSRHSEICWFSHQSYPTLSFWESSPCSHDNHIETEENSPPPVKCLLHTDLLPLGSGLGFLFLSSNPSILYSLYSLCPFNICLLLVSPCIPRGSSSTLTHPRGANANANANAIFVQVSHTPLQSSTSFSAERFHTCDFPRNGSFYLHT